MNSEHAANLEWLDRFERQAGRPLRVLHVGNVANNAYLNAKFLRRVGVCADVLSHDYYHVMATPEWEDLPLERGHGDDLAPRLDRHDLAGYERPAWFVQGPIEACIAALEPTRPASLRQRLLRRLLHRRAWRPVPGNATRAAARVVAHPRDALGLVRIVLGRIPGIRALVRPDMVGSLRRAAARIPGARALFRRVVRASVRQGRTQAPGPGAPGAAAGPAAAPGQALDDVAVTLDDFRRAFPDRPDPLTVEDVVAGLPASKRLREVFDGYDVVQCYGLAPILAYQSGARPYVAYEHGTLRVFTMDDDPIHRMNALSYRRADHVFITNGDCRAYAQRLGIEAYAPMIHPVDVEQHRERDERSIEELRAHYGADVLLFCPVRHDYEIKGTDVHLRALPMLRDALGDRSLALVLLAWGEQLDESRRIIESAGCSDVVHWLPSLPRPRLIRHVQAADVVLDQMALPHFGATAPQALAAGTPVISSYEPSSTAWIVDEPAPILPAFKPEDVVQSVITAVDPQWRKDFQERARSWVDRYHHPDRVIHHHLRVYREVLRNRHGD